MSRATDSQGKLQDGDVDLGEATTTAVVACLNGEGRGQASKGSAERTESGGLHGEKNVGSWILFKKVLYCRME
jgi:hypothetical protein